MPEPLAPERLKWRCPEEAVGYERTDRAETSDRIVGQERAVRAVRLGLEIQATGYNMFVTGVSGTGRESTVKRILESLDLTAEGLKDILYVHNFEDPQRPVVITLPADEGESFVESLGQCVELLKRNIPAVMSGERINMERKKIHSDTAALQQGHIEAFSKEASARGFSLVSIPTEPGQFRPDVLPVVENQAIGFEKLEELVNEGRITAEERDRLLADHDLLFNRLIEVMRRNQKLEAKAAGEDRELVRRLLRPTVEGILSRLKEIGDPKVAAYADSLCATILDNLEVFLNPQQDEDPFYLFTANMLVDNSRRLGRPVVVEQFPDQVSLFGSIDRLTVDNKPYSDFTMIRPGALLRANGGYIIMDAMDILRQPGLWPALMQTLRNKTLVIRQHDPLNLFPIDLQPEPVEIDVKVILLGSDHLYQMLGMSEPEFEHLFRIRADFDDEMDLEPASIKDFAGVVAFIARNEKLTPLSAGAVAALAEQAVRMASRRDRLSTQFNSIADYARQAAYWAGCESSPLVEAGHVRKAILEKRARLSMRQEYALNSIDRGEILIDTSGSRVGLVNGLVVLGGVDYTFGLPMRVTARVSAGREGLIDIEREADLSGAIHTKGVLIITGFLRGRFARDFPLSLSASICIEQSYGGVEGDSASCAELYALLSALSEIPLRQDLAVTGSVNQYGEVQPIGGVNYKVEGFYNVCRRRGLTGTQGVLIPASNVDSLQLDDDVVEAVERGMFHVYPISTVDEGIELLTGVPAGVPDSPGGPFPDGSVNGRAEAALRRMAEILRNFSREVGGI